MNRSEAISMLSNLSTEFGSEPLMVQGAGGNISVKTSDGSMIVKASGIPLKNVTKEFGWVSFPFGTVCGLVDAGPHAATLDPKTDDWLAAEIDTITTPSQANAKASIEAAMHAVLGPVVVHTHPVAINVFLCAVNGRALCQEIFKEISFAWIDPFPPGYYLARAIKDEMATSGRGSTAVLFLASHGVIVHGESGEAVSSMFDKIQKIARDWLRPKGIDLKSLPLDDWETEISQIDIFPDTVVFHNLAKQMTSVAPDKRQGIIETFAASKLIRTLQAKVGIESAPLLSDTCDYILGMAREKHRQAEAQKSGGLCK